jgi:hypothetical protein
MRKLLFCIFLFNSFFANADIPLDEFEIIDIQRNETVKLGDIFSKIIRMYPDIVFKGERKSSSITYKEYECDGIIFFISAYAKTESNTGILGIEIKNTRYKVKRGISIGNTRDEVIQKYGSADYVHNNLLIYINREYDHCELLFRFNENGCIISIVLFTGT